MASSSNSSLPTTLGDASPFAQPMRRKSPRLHINIDPPSLNEVMPPKASELPTGEWYRPELPEEDIPLNLGTETTWDGMENIGVAQGRQRSNTVVGGLFPPFNGSTPSINGLGLDTGPTTGDAEEPLQPQPHLDGVSSAYGFDLPVGAEFDNELTKRLLREKKQLKEQGRWVDDGDIEEIVLRRTIPEDQGVSDSNLLCNICFRRPGELSLSGCRHIFCTLDLQEYLRRTIRPETKDVSCPVCGTSSSLERDVISVSTGRSVIPALLADQPRAPHHPTSDRPAQPHSRIGDTQSSAIPSTQHAHPSSSKAVKQRSIDRTRYARTPQLPSPPITPAPSLPISLYELRASEKGRQVVPGQTMPRTGLFAAVEKTVGDQFSRVFSIIALALVLWVLVK
ncbi:hypothetical protein BDV93DRAFT_519163 [Ceratobasidium sp. AG-I]|nr:hypothetical protein BDV93DRAFT_519163 [Ceratobasidium sp. AG-I]